MEEGERGSISGKLWSQVGEGKASLSNLIPRAADLGLQLKTLDEEWEKTAAHIWKTLVQLH